MTEGDLTFERALLELESIADSLEADDVDLDEALALFERGIDRLRVAARLLDAAHGRVEELVEGVAGSLETRPMEVAREDPGEPEEQ
jgi:exodeoxyribonuclease VII small subunit